MVLSWQIWLLVQADLAGGIGAAWRGLGFADALSHAARLPIPVLLTTGEEDGTCPITCVHSPFEALPGVRSFMMVRGVGHEGPAAFPILSKAWLEAYL